MEKVYASHVEAQDPGDPWEIQTKALGVGWGVACPLEQVRDEAFQVAIGTVAALCPQSLWAQHGGVLSHEDHGGPAASETSLDGASHLAGMDEDVSARVQDVQFPGFLLMVNHFFQPQEEQVVGAWLGVSQVEGL